MKYGARIIAFACLLISTAVRAQRVSTYNTIGWFASNNTIHYKKTSLLLEYQWRRAEFTEGWQQSLFRTGIQYAIKKDISVLVGYGYIVTFPYGDFPSGPHHIPEHRIFEQLSWNDVKGRIAINHRFRLEQRYLGKIDQTSDKYDVQGWNYVNRIRYQLRANVAINKKKIEDKTWSAGVYDELFIGFGKNVNQNIFDQNRIGVVAGYQFNKHFRAEAGFLNQVVQQGGLINGKEVFQYNNGVIVTVYTNLFN